MNTAERKQLRKDKPGVWVPVEAGDVLAGTVVDIAAAWSDAQYDGKDEDTGFYPLLRVAVGDETTGYKAGETLALHAFARVLQDRILDAEPAPGEEIIVTYEGTSENKQKGRNAAELYRLELPDRDPRETARRVYGKLAGKRRGRAVNGNPGSDLPADTSGLPAEASAASRTAQGVDPLPY